MISRLSPPINLIIILLFVGNTYGQATITIEVNWTSDSSINYVSLFSPGSTTLAQVCNANACWNYADLGPYNNLSNPTEINNVTYDSNYLLRLFNNNYQSWATGSYVRVYRDGVLILETTKDSDTYQQDFYFDILQPELVADDVVVNENTELIEFDVTNAGNNTAGPYTIDYQLNNLTTNSEDFSGPTSGTLSFSGASNETQKISIPIVNDNFYEVNETFSLSFSNASDAEVIISNTAIGTINDDDGILIKDGQTLNSCSGTILDPGRNNDYESNENIIYTICPLNTGDYSKLSFSEFDMHTSDALFIYEGTDASGTLIGAYDNDNIPTTITATESTGCLTIRFISNGDNDVGTGLAANVSCVAEGPRIVIDDVVVNEQDGLAIFSLTQTYADNSIVLPGDTSATPIQFEVLFRTVNGSAIAGEDFTYTEGSILFNGLIGNTQTISIPIIEDNNAELEETFYIEFIGTNNVVLEADISDTATAIITTQRINVPPLELFKEFDGKFDYTTAGGSLRTTPNRFDKDTDGNGIFDDCEITNISTGQLTAPIPPTASITNAYLYWAHSSELDSLDTNISFDGNSVQAAIINSYDQTDWVERVSAYLTKYFYGYVSDITSIVQNIPDINNHTFTFTDLNVVNDGNHCEQATVLGGWALIIFYEDPNLAASNINLYQGFQGNLNATTTYSLDSFYFSGILSGSAKATLLSWEGDQFFAANNNGGGERLTIKYQNGSSLRLSGDGSNTDGENAFNSTIFDNTSGTIYNSDANYGLDLDTYDISSNLQQNDTQLTAEVEAGNDLVISNAVILKVPTNIVSGTVFEDINYPGGPGRNITTSNGIGIANAFVEIYDANDNLVDRTATDENGEYAFGGIANGTYKIRVVNSSVRSNRNGGASCFGCKPVLTFRNEFMSGSVVEVTDEVGGANPSAFQDSGLGIIAGAKSVATASVSSSGVFGLNFGFNFNTIVNTNFQGEGSLNQFIFNANNLGEATLDIEANSIFDPAPEEDTAIFMIPSATDPLGRAADPNFTNGSHFEIAVPSFVPLHTITDDTTIIDGRTQTAYSGNTNTTAVGNLSSFDGAEITIVGTADIFNVEADNIVIRNLFLSSSTGTLINVNQGSVIVQNNAFGIDSSGNSAGNAEVGIVNYNGATTVHENYISNNTTAGILAEGGILNSFENNEIISNNIGVKISTNNVMVNSNTIANNTNSGIVVANGIGNQISENSFYANGGLGIDLDASKSNGDGITINDDGDSDTDPNNLINFPVISNAVVFNGTLTVKGWAPTGATIEIYFTDISEGTATTGDNQFALSKDYGEGQVFIASVVEGSASDLDNTTSNYVDVDGSTETTSRFHFEIPLSLVAKSGDSITALASTSDGTSEFGAMYSILEMITHVITNRRLTYRVSKK